MSADAEDSGTALKFPPPGEDPALAWLHSEEAVRYQNHWVALDPDTGALQGFADDLKELRACQARGALVIFVDPPPEPPEPTLEQRVAALEAEIERLAHPPMIAHLPPLSAEEEARFKGEFEAALKDIGQRPYAYRILPSPPPLTPDEIRQLLRESVTALKGGEVLFYTVGDPNCTPNQIREIQSWINSWLEHNADHVKVLVLPHGEMAAAEAVT